MLNRWTSKAVTIATGACLAITPMLVPTPAVGSSARTSVSVAAPRHLEANLRFEPGGDRNGRGHADFTLFRKRGRVCADVTWRRIGTPLAAHIHRKIDGGIVVDLTGSVTGGKKCNPDVSSKLVRRILNHPRRYYFNVHNEKHPGGAIRGTLHR